MRVHLSVLFNHPYPANIPFLREHYGKRYDHVIFIQPLRVSQDEDVITSFRGSFHFQGMIADAGPRLLASNADYFIFVHDDVLLNPLFAGDTLIQKLQVKEHGAFISSLFPLPSNIRDWPWLPGFVWKVLRPEDRATGAGISNLLSYFPDPAHTRARLEEVYNFRLPKLTISPRPDDKSVSADGEREIAKIREVLGAKEAESIDFEFPYPFLGGYSDFIVMSREALERALPLFGVTAAANLFVEIALPTALTAAVKRVMTCDDVGLTMETLWTQEDRDSLENDDLLIERFKKDLLLLHPIKLSVFRDRFVNIVDKVESGA